MSEMLDTWPFLPVTLSSRVEWLRSGLPHPRLDQWWDNIVAALESEHHNHICEIHILDMTNSRLERFTAAMQKPFQELTDLHISMGYRDSVPVLPDLFLAGSAPRLRQLFLERIPFPSMPKLLLSVNGLAKRTLGYS